MLEFIKKALRIRHTALDDVIETYITAAINDMALKGVKQLDEEDPLIMDCVAAYVSMLMNDNPQVVDMWYKSYERQLDGLRKSARYGES